MGAVASTLGACYGKPGEISKAVLEIGQGKFVPNINLSNNLLLRVCPVVRARARNRNRNRPLLPPFSMFRLRLRAPSR
jgi:hypothetical protein